MPNARGHASPGRASSDPIPPARCVQSRRGLIPPICLSQNQRRGLGERLPSRFDWCCRDLRCVRVDVRYTASTSPTLPGSLNRTGPSKLARTNLSAERAVETAVITARYGVESCSPCPVALSSCPCPRTHWSAPPVRRRARPRLRQTAEPQSAAVSAVIVADPERRDQERRRSPSAATDAATPR